MPTTATRVLDTPELLESILLHLPLQDLLHSQRVSRQFHAAITSSPSIQQALFLRAKRRKSSPNEWEINPLFRKAFLPWFLYPEPNCPILPNYDTLELLDCNSTKQKRIAYARPEASWRRMFFMQPPPQKLTVKKFCHAMGGDRKSVGELLFDADENDGVRMDVLYDIPVSFLSMHSVSSFGLQVHAPGPDNDEASTVTLQLRYTQQCCPSEPNQCPQMKSLADKKWNYMDIKFKALRSHGFNSRAYWSWTSDITLDLGGVSLVELKEWEDKRRPDDQRLLGNSSDEE